MPPVNLPPARGKIPTLHASACGMLMSCKTPDTTGILKFYCAALKYCVSPAEIFQGFETGLRYAVDITFCKTSYRAP